MECERGSQKGDTVDDHWNASTWLEPRADAVMAELELWERHWATHLVLPIGIALVVVGALTISPTAALGVLMVVVGIRWFRAPSR